jgi:hypothetical protein
MRKILTKTAVLLGLLPLAAMSANQLIAVNCNPVDAVTVCTFKAHTYPKDYNKYILEDQNTAVVEFYHMGRGSYPKIHVESNSFIKQVSYNYDPQAEKATIKFLLTGPVKIEEDDSYAGVLALTFSH